MEFLLSTYVGLDIQVVVENPVREMESILENMHHSSSVLYPKSFLLKSKTFTDKSTQRKRWYCRFHLTYLWLFITHSGLSFLFKPRPKCRDAIIFEQKHAWAIFVS